MKGRLARGGLFLRPKVPLDSRLNAKNRAGQRQKARDDKICLSFLKAERLCEAKAKAKGA